MIASLLSRGRILSPSLCRVLLSRPSAVSYHEQRLIQNRAPQGLTWESLKRHNSLVPLFIIMGALSVALTAHCFRLLFLAPDEQDLEVNEPFKLMTVFDRQRISPAPRYKTMTEEEGEKYKVHYKVE